MRIAYPIFIILIFSISCNPDRNSAKTVTIIEKVVNSFEIENEIKDTIECDLSEIADSLRIIRLETLNSVVMGGIYSMVLWKNYLVIGTERDYYLYNEKGKFIRRLLKTGRGPEEFITPQFSQVVRNGILYFSDAQKNRNYIYSIDLQTGKLGRNVRPGDGYIQCFFPDTDSSFIILSEVFTRDKVTPLSASRKFSLIRQDFNGTLMNEIPLGSQDGVFPFKPSLFSMFFDNNEILISKPRFDTLFSIKDFKVHPIWHNIFKTNYNDQLSMQKVPNARLVHYSDSSIIMKKCIMDINGNRAQNRDNQLLLVDRRNNKVKNIKNFYFIDKNMKVGFSPDIQLINDQFCIVLKAKDVARLLNNQLFSKSIEDMMVLDNPRTNSSITEFDNPFLIIGKFK